MTTKRQYLNARYARFAEINGDHPYKQAIPGAYVDYPARTRYGGRLVYFNFDLAKEMGLIPADHEHVITKPLSQIVLDTFSIEIINEYDVLHKTVIPSEDVRSHCFMATRYLQLQHPSRQGLTSGDGRSIWNGTFRGLDAVWDVTSCGTGATRLSPATAISHRFFKTGDKKVSYGCGRADLLDGVAAALMSDIFHRNGISTERALAVIGFDDGSAINVRAGKNLLRPAHFFRHLKQNDLDGLRRTVEYYIQRQVENGEWPAHRSTRQRYRDLLTRVTVDFARTAAVFEMEYVFCWLDWDGDNILTDGGIIDYGSVRQFGLFHHEYRYDDVERYSTTIPEQRAKARYVVRCFAQIVDFLLTGKKKNIHRFSRDPTMKLFDSVYQWTKDDAILRKMGLTSAQSESLLRNKRSARHVHRFQEVCRYFEKAKSRRGPYDVADGINWDAIFCLRDVLRELPQHLLINDLTPMSPQQFVTIMRSRYADDDDMKLSMHRIRRIQEFQELYTWLVREVSMRTRHSIPHILRQIMQRSATINRYDRVTGDAIVKAAQALVRNVKSLTANDLQRTMEQFVDAQVLIPDYKRRILETYNHDSQRVRQRIFKAMIKIVQDCRDGI